jgi:hypothetical protein
MKGNCNDYFPYSAELLPGAIHILAMHSPKDVSLDYLKAYKERFEKMKPHL